MACVDANSRLLSDEHGGLPGLGDDPVTRDYVASMLRSPPETLSTPALRSEFLLAVLGPDDLAHEAEEDMPLLRQLETRVCILLAECDLLLPAIDACDADSVVALLAAIANRWPLLLDAMEKAGATAFVIHVMRTFSHYSFVAARALTALRAFAVTDAMRKRVMFDGGMDLTLDLMSMYRTDQKVQDRAVGVIANVAFGCTHRKRRIARQGAVRSIINGMSTFPNDENIQLRGALTIRNLTVVAQVNQYIAGNEGAVEAISSTLLRFRGSSNAGVRFQCVLALESLCHDDERNRQRLIDIDNLSTAAVKEAAIVANESLHRFDGVDEETINEDGDIIVDDEEILVPDISLSFCHGAALFPGKSADKIMTSLSITSSGCSEKTATSLVLDESKLNLGNEADVKRAKTGEELKPNEKKSIVRAIVNAIRRDPDDPLLLEAALSLLLLIGMNRADMQTRIGQLGGVYVAIAAIRRHEGLPSLVGKACALIRCLCLQQENRAQVTSGLPVLISAAQTHCKDGEVVQEIASALSNAVFQHDKNRAWVTRKGGIDAIVQAMDTCGAGDAMVLEASICALRNFIDSSNSGALCAANEGAVSAAVNALDSTKEASSTGERIVQEQAVLLLVDLARLAPQTKEEMVEVDAADWIENALAKLSIGSYPELHASGDKLITALEAGNRGLAYGKHAQHVPPPSPTTITGRAFSRGLFGAFSLPRRANSRGMTQSRWRNHGPKSSMGASEGDFESRARRFSSRLAGRT